MTATKFVPDLTITTAGAVPSPNVPVVEQGTGPAQNVWPPNDSGAAAPQWTNPADVVQATWYIDSVNGRDTNVGSAAAPLQTWNEFVTRLGPDPIIGSRIDVYIVTDLLPTDTLLMRGTYTPTGALYVHGVPTVQRTSTLTGVVPYNQATNQWDELQDGAFDFTPYVGTSLIIVETGDPNGPSYCWPIAALGAGRVRVSFLGQRNPVNQAGENIGPATIGNTYRIVTLPYVNNFLETAQGYAQTTDAQLYLEFLHLPIFAQLLPAYTVFTECMFDGVIAEDFAGILVNPCLLTSVAVQSGAFSTQLGTLLNGQGFLNSGIWVAFGLIMQNSKIDTSDLSGNGAASIFQAHHTATGLGIFDSADPLVFAEGGSVMFEGALWGQNNTGTTLTLKTGGRAFVDAPASARLFAATPAAGHDFTIDGYTALPAVDPVTFVPTANRSLSFANYLKTVATGGFEFAVFNPRFPSTGIVGG